MSIWIDVLSPARCRRLMFAMVLGVGVMCALAASSARAATDHFTCRASAIRALGVAGLSSADQEPAVANPANDPCVNDHAAIADSPAALSSALGTSTGAASATTASSAGGASATASVANPTALGTTLDVTAQSVQASVGYACSAGAPVASGSSRVDDLSIGGGAPITTSGPVTLPAGGVADVELNQTIGGTTSVTRRAVDITVLSGASSGAQIVLGEATAGVSGNPCSSTTGNPGGGSGPGSGGGSQPPIGGGAEPVITSYPPSSTASGDATFDYHTSIPGATLQCRLDGSPYTACSGHTSYTGLSVGTHTFSVRSVSNGIPGPPTVYTWKVVRGCPAATGSLSGDRLGLVRLGMTRKQTRAAYRYSSDRGKRFEDFFCVKPARVRVGYASATLLKSLSRGQRKQFTGRVVLALTANRHYTLRGVRPGARFAMARHKLGKGNLVRVGRNDWYLARHGSTTSVLKVQRGAVQEIGIANGRITRTRRAQRTFIRSFS